MRRHLRNVVALLAVVVASLAAATPSVAQAHEPAIRHLRYEPTPAYSSLPAFPDPTQVAKPNPTGTWNAYDLNVFETIWFPFRQANDADADAEPGGAIAHGVCPIDGCENHSLEFARFWKRSMRSIVEPLGGVVSSHAFHHEARLPGAYVWETAGGTAHNLIATVPGSEHPEQVVVVAGHYDQTRSGPASAWDSADGQATVVRIAKLMTDYWLRTNTRPAVTVKFAAWAGEDSGGWGSWSFIRDHLQPFPNLRARAYFNLDPCGGGYPAFYQGNPVHRIRMVMGLSDPARVHGAAPFNRKAREALGDVMNHLDDRLTDVPGSPEIFISDEEAESAGVVSDEELIVPVLNGTFIYGDTLNFEAVGAPIFNLFPDMLGPNGGPESRPDGLAILHTPNDNLLTLNAITGPDQTGRTASQGWFKAQEFCAHLYSWLMLQPHVAGAVRYDGPIAYFQVGHGGGSIRPNEELSFDASASRVHREDATFLWDLGDGTRSKGRRIHHRYRGPGTYQATLTVRSRGLQDKMDVWVNVVG